ncbi:hypothetical protein [Streptomyces apricus]|uniref:Uncharacterized protein n=1 Tax=Streptomyces apricus TaxID=1828112 RepID=A0A5A9ZX39_9ACTN|nr:hypothetical protein [Streptomyces apricus]KAA0921312.1 hypothetical protein FGF04_36615 [Streptomyces apricus]
MGDDNGGIRLAWRRDLRETLGGAHTELEPGSLADLAAAPGLREAYLRFGTVFPEEQLQLQALYGESQRAFEARTRQALEVTVRRVLLNVLGDQRLGAAEPDRHLAAYLEQEILRIRVRVEQDRELAVNRGLNLGFLLGMGLLVVLLVVPLLVGERLLGLCDVSLGCTDRWSLLGALVCGGAGAFGAVFSVLTRLRNKGDQLTRRPANGSREAVAPAQGARAARRGGVHRVLIGWMLAIAVYLLLSSGLVTVIEVPAGIADICSAQDHAASAGTAFWGFWGAVGFLAGFNERWAYGLVGRGGTARKA